MEKQSPAYRESINWDVIKSYILSSIPGIPNEEMKVTKFAEGFSNLTYLIELGNWNAVLRRPPFGYTPPKAHNMEREYEIIKNLHNIYPYAPKPYIFCDDRAVMEKHFYIMEKKSGLVIDRQLPVEYLNKGYQISQAAIKGLVELHSLDYKSACFENFGKPKGYLERQVYSWIERYKRSKTDTFPYEAEVEKWLVDNIPINEEVSVIHNDYKLNNLMFDDQKADKLVGVFDWELATIGDPLSDLGTTLAYWMENVDPPMIVQSATTQGEFYSRRELLESYAKLSGRDVSQISFYLTFGFYRIAVIMQQIYYRWKIGQAKDKRFGLLKNDIESIFQLAEAAMTNRIL